MLRSGRFRPCLDNDNIITQAERICKRIFLEIALLLLHFLRYRIKSYKCNHPDQAQLMVEGLGSFMMASFSTATAFLSPSSVVMRLSSCSMEMGPS